MQATYIKLSLTAGYLYLLDIFLILLRIVAMGTSTASARLSAFASAYAPLLVSGRLHALNWSLLIIIFSSKVLLTETQR